MSETAAQPIQDTSQAELDHLVGDIDKIEQIVAGWDEHYQLTAKALKSAIEDLHKEAIKRIIRILKDDAAAGAKLREAVGDRVVFGVLLYHGLIKEPLESRLEKALAEVRPMLEGHGGNVELVAVKPPDTVEIRLVGACHGCPASGQTLTEGIEKAIKDHCPEIVNVNQVSRGKSEIKEDGDKQVYYISPFAGHHRSNWTQACLLNEIPNFDILERMVDGRSVLLYRQDDIVSCVDNSCAHMGMPLETGTVSAGVLTCPYHGFQYLLETGECLTAPEVQLKVHGVRVVGPKVEVRLEV